MYLNKVIRPRLLSSGQTLLSGHYFFAFGAMGMYAPFLPLYLASRGLNSFQIGLLLAIVPFTGIFAQMAWGNYADKHNRRKEYLVAAVAASAVFGVAHSVDGSIVMIALFIFLFSCFFSAIAPLTDSIALQTTTETHNYGLFRRWGSLGYACTSVAGGLLFTIVPLAWFGVIAGCVFVISLLGSVWLPNFNQNRPVFNGFPLGQVLRIPGILTLCFVILMVTIPDGAYKAFLGWHLESLGAARSWIGMAWAVAAVSEVPVFGWGIRWLGKWPARQLLAAAAAAYAVRWLIYAFIPSYPIIVLLQLSQSITYALFYLAAVEHLAQRVPSHLYSSSQAILLTVYGIGSIVGSIGGGWMVQHFSFQALYISMAVLSAVAFWRLQNEMTMRNKSKPEFTLQR